MAVCKQGANRTANPRHRGGREILHVQFVLSENMFGIEQALIS